MLALPCEDECNSPGRSKRLLVTFSLRMRAKIIVAAALLLGLVAWDFAAATTFVGDDYLFLAFARLEPNPLLAFTRDMHRRRILPAPAHAAVVAAQSGGAGRPVAVRPGGFSAARGKRCSGRGTGPRGGVHVAGFVGCGRAIPDRAGRARGCAVVCGQHRSSGHDRNPLQLWSVCCARREAGKWRRSHWLRWRISRRKRFGAAAAWNSGEVGGFISQPGAAENTGRRGSSQSGFGHASRRWFRIWLWRAGT